MGIDARESLYTKQQLRDIARAARMELARRSLINFTKYTNPLYVENWHHKTNNNIISCVLCTVNSKIS